MHQSASELGQPSNAPCLKRSVAFPLEDSRPTAWKEFDPISSSLLQNMFCGAAMFFMLSWIPRCSWWSVPVSSLVCNLYSSVYCAFRPPGKCHDHASTDSTSVLVDERFYLADELGYDLCVNPRTEKQKLEMMRKPSIIYRGIFLPWRASSCEKSQIGSTSRIVHFQFILSAGVCLVSALMRIP